MKLVQLLIFSVLFIPTSCVDTSAFAKWEVTKTSADEISWAKFEWVDGALGGRLYKKTGINISCKIDGVPNALTFQLDLGASLTGVYENIFAGFYQDHPELMGKIKSRSSKISYYENLTFKFGEYTATNNSGYVYKNFGSTQEINPGEIIHLGSIGADIFQNKLLIIDYPNKRFAVCESLPADYAVNFVHIALDERGRVLLPMMLRDRPYNIMFDTGSSLFPIITSLRNVSLFSTSPDMDVIQVSAWGQLHNVTGKMIKDPVLLGGQTFENVKVYGADFSLGINRSLDGITGNVLFWDRVVVIDFKNLKFGVK